MRYRLRTLLILFAIAPLFLSVAYFQFQHHRAWRRRFEGPFIHQAKFLGNYAFSDKKLLKVSGVNKSVRLNAYNTDQSLRKLQSFYSQQGYAQAKISIVEGHSPRDKSLVFQISEGAKKSP